MNQVREKAYDLLISGAGIPGACLALSAARLGLRVALIDRRETLVKTDDSRTTAFLPESLQFLDDLGLMAPIHEAAQPLRIMRLLNDSPPYRDKPRPLDFEGPEGAPLALNVPNAVLASALQEALSRPELALEYFWNTQVTEAKVVAGQAHLHLDTKPGLTTNLTAPLAVAADGRESSLRTLLNIGWQDMSPHQTALTARLRHERPHAGISSEFHRQSGPMTFVPVAGDGHDCALVWCLRDGVGADVSALSEAAFRARVQIASQGILGTIHAVSARGRFPVRPGQALTLAKGPFVLLAEAAHALPPLLAQGLNLSLTDVRVLANLIKERGLSHATAVPIAAAYATARQGDLQVRLGISQGLNRFLMQAPASVQGLYDIGHRGLAALPAARRLAVRLGQRGYQRPPRPS